MSSPTPTPVHHPGCFLLSPQRLIEEENMLAPSPKQFSLRIEMLPSYIPVRVAEKILFVGESVQMFESQNVSFTKKGRALGFRSS